MDAATYKSFGGRDFGGNTDWLKAITRTALSHAHHLGILGSLLKTNYSASLNYRNIEGIELHSGHQSLNARFSVTQKALNDRLKLTGIFSSTRNEARPGANDAFQQAAVANPTPLTLPTARRLSRAGEAPISSSPFLEKRRQITTKLIAWPLVCVETARRGWARTINGITSRPSAPG